MGKYILVFQIHEHTDMGGGTFLEKFGQDESSMHTRVNELATKWGGSFSVALAGFMQYEFAYTAVKKVVEYEPKRVDSNT